MGIKENSAKGRKSAKKLTLDDLMDNTKEVTEVTESKAETAVEEPSDEMVNEAGSTELPVVNEVEQTVDKPLTEDEPKHTAEETKDEIKEADSVIKEYTEENNQSLPNKDKKPLEKEPWYIARLKRVSDYYNW